jgi:thiamine-monophosphate kinase
MAGTPTAAVITLGLPKGFDAERVEKIYSGLNALARAHSVAIAGGETVLNPGQILISVALIGTAPKGKCVLRSGAKARDAIFVTGELGGSLAGHHLDFSPRLEEARWLAENFSIHSMIDVSDGLAGDLRHILHAGHVGVELLGTAIPVSQSARLASKAESSAKPPLLAALTDGEDFELLFTLASRDAVPLLDAWKARFPDIKLSCIGKITEEPGLRLRSHDGIRPFTAHGYQHFA